MSKKSLTRLHIIIIIVGAIFIALPIFHTNLWFDESYSVAMAEHDFKQIWLIGGNDVHPILYYWVLHIINLLFNNSIIAYRVFSWLCMVLTGIVGFTHIRKDFGEKVGILFSFLSLFIPMTGEYSGEIRMYSLGLLLGTLMCIYAYRIYKNSINKTTFLFFGLSSLALSYTHYYGLMLAGIVNLILFVYLIINYKNRKLDFIKFTFCIIIQIVLYIPWLLNFIKQLKSVSKGFWISTTFPETLYEILTIQYRGNIPILTSVFLTAIFYLYLIYLFVMLIRKKEEIKVPAYAFLVYLTIIVFAVVISKIMRVEILLDRYLIIVTGLLLFTTSYIMGKQKNIYITVIICMCIFSISCYSMLQNINKVYDENNTNCVEYMKENIQSNDIVLYSDAINGAVVSTQFSNNKAYFYNKENWGIHEAYKAFSNMKIEENLNNILDKYSGRIWLIEGKDNHELYDEISLTYEVEKVQEKNFEQKYKDLSITIELINKE